MAWGWCWKLERRVRRLGSGIGGRRTECIGEEEKEDQHARRQHAGREEAKARSAQFDDGGTGPAGAWRQTGGADQDQNEGRTACGLWEKGESKDTQRRCRQENDSGVNTANVTNR